MHLHLFFFKFLTNKFDAHNYLCIRRVIHLYLHT